MRITYHGHACCSLFTAGGMEILIDPFITGNPQCRQAAADFHPDAILLTHGHNDHLGDALAIARANNAVLIGQVDLLNQLDTQGIDNIAFNLGGSVNVRDAQIHMVAAWHGSSVAREDGKHYGGVACGYVVEDEPHSVYHAGDTALFGDMGTVISRYGLDCALLPIGGFYTMGSADAITAAHWLKAKQVIPMHYNTFPAITVDVAEFARQLEDKTESRAAVLAPGESIQL
ncbi:MAG: metal-dependent hydrolase [Bacillota bacterium]|nr:metal-dependent hydrolase [Bacillota bacterium]